MSGFVSVKQTRRWELSLYWVIAYATSAEKVLGFRELNQTERMRRFLACLKEARSHSRGIKREDLKIEALLNGLELRGCAKLGIAVNSNKERDQVKTVLPINEVSETLYLAAESFSQAAESTDKKVRYIAERLHKRCQADAIKNEGNEAMKDLDFNKARKSYKQCEALFGNTPWLEAALLEVEALESTVSYDQNYLKMSHLDLSKLAGKIAELYSRAESNYKKEIHPDIRNSHFCSAMAALFRYLSTGSEHDQIEWLSKKEILSSEVFESDSPRGDIRRSIFKMAKTMIDHGDQFSNARHVRDEIKLELVGEVGEPGLEGRLRPLWIELKNKVPAAKYDKNGNKLHGTLGELFVVFKDYCNIAEPPELIETYRFFRDTDKHALMSVEEYQTKVEWARELVDSGRLTKIITDYEISVHEACKQYLKK